MCSVYGTLENGVVTKVEGNRDAHLYNDFFSPNGRAVEAAHNDPNRLPHHLKRIPDGRYVRISSKNRINDIAAKIEVILEERNPDTVATSFRNGGL